MVGTQELYRRRLLIVLCIGVLLIVGMCLYPPWVVHGAGGGTPFVGYAILWGGPEREYELAGKVYRPGADGEYTLQERESGPDACRQRIGTKWFLFDASEKLSAHPDIGRLVLQCVPVAALTAIGVLTLRTRRRESSTSDDG